MMLQPATGALPFHQFADGSGDFGHSQLGIVMRLGADQAFTQPTRTFTAGPTNWSPAPPPDIPTVATGRVPPAGRSNPSHANQHPSSPLTNQIFRAPQPH